MAALRFVYTDSVFALPDTQAQKDKKNYLH